MKTMKGIKKGRKDNRFCSEIHGGPKIYSPNADVQRAANDALEQLWQTTPQSHRGKDKWTQRVRKWKRTEGETLGLRAKGCPKLVDDSDDDDTCENAAEGALGKRTNFLLGALVFAVNALASTINYRGESSVVGVLSDLASASTLFSLCGFGGHSSFPRMLSLRMLQSVGFCQGGLAQLGTNTWRVATWLSTGVLHEEVSRHPPLLEVVPAFKLLLPFMRRIVLFHLGETWTHLVVYQCLGHMCCETQKWLTGDRKRHPSWAARSELYWHLLQPMMGDRGMERQEHTTGRAPAFIAGDFAGLPAGGAECALLILHLFEALVVRFAVQRLRLAREPCQLPAKSIYKSDRFRDLRMCQWTFALDLGHLSTWHHVLRWLVPFAPHHASACDISFCNPSPGTPATCLKYPLVDVLANIWAAVTLLTSGEARHKLGWITPDHANLQRLLRGVKLTWPYGRACQWRSIHLEPSYIWTSDIGA